jgi:hypothetical protein
MCQPRNYTSIHGDAGSHGAADAAADLQTPVRNGTAPVIPSWFNSQMHRKSDLTALASLFAFGAMIGAATILNAGNTFFYQQFTPELVMWACGRGFVYVADKPQALHQFLFGLQPNFDCRVLDQIQHTQAAGVFVQKQLYLDVPVALLWRLLGVSYAALWPLFAVLHGAYAAGCYALARLFYRRWVAFALAVFLALSPVAVAMLFTLRDYSKAPFFIWCIVLLLLALRALRPRTAIICGALAGLAVGIGTGFRSDTLILLPIGSLILLVGSDGAMLRWRIRGATLAAFMGVAGVLASPIWGIGSDGGFGILAMQGATEPFERFLGVRSGPYNLGWRYSDELTLSSVTADLRPNDPNWDANESPPVVGVSQSMKRSAGYLLGWAPLFAADFATHALKAAGWLAGYAALVEPGHRALDPAGVLVPGTWFGKLLEPVYRLLGQPILPWLGGLGLVCLLLQAYARSRRESAALAVLLAPLLTYPAIQFSVRHAFQLEIISWLGLLALVAMPFRWREARSSLRGFAAWAVGLAIPCAVAYAALIAFQDHALPARVADLLRLPREPIAVQAAPGADGRARLPIPLPDRYQGLVAAAADSMQISIPEIGNQWEVRAAADRLLISIGGPSCPPGRFALSFQYRKRPDVWQPLDHDVMVPVPLDASSRTMLIAPAFYRPTQYLEALVLPADRAACVDKVERMVGHTPLPMTFSAVLPHDWATARWHQAFGWFAKPPD